jgi:hypothetical protein
MFDVHTTCRGSFVFESLFVFLPWLAGRFYNSDLTQNGEKLEIFKIGTVSFVLSKCQ